MSRDRAARFRRDLVVDMGLDAGTLDRPGTTVAVAEDRAGTGYAAAYEIGRHRVLWTDGAIADRLTELVSPTTSIDDAGLLAFADGLGWRVLGTGVMKVRGGDPPTSPQMPPRHELHRFDWARAADLALMADLVGASSAEDLDEAEVELDDLDDCAVGVVDPDGRLVAFASCRPWRFGSLGDIGVITRSGVRGGGLGRAVVAGLIDRMTPDLEPLYRHDENNVASGRLSDSLGFVPATRLVAIGPPT